MAKEWTKGFAALVVCVGAVACGAGEEPIDKRGPIELVVDGEPYGIHADRFQAEHAEDHAMAFHMHVGSENWYMEGPEPVTVAEGLELLPHVAFENEGPVLRVDGTSYDASDEGVAVQVLIDGQPVDPGEHVLDDGEHLRVEVTTR